MTFTPEKIEATARALFKSLTGGRFGTFDALAGDFQDNWRRNAQRYLDEIADAKETT